MALTGTLLADFSAFVAEAGKATTAVKTLEKGGDDAAAKLAKFGENFNLKDALNNPLSTATDLLKEFGGSLGTAGIAAVAAGAGVVALGTALFSLGVYAADAIARFDDLADKTGMSVPALSRLSHAANVVGADLTQLTDVVFKLERGIGENTPAFQKGLAAMSLSTEDLRAAGPDQYLELVTEGLKGINDPATRAAAGTAVLGKGYRDVAAALNDLGDGLRMTADIPAFTQQQAADAERFLFQLASLKEHVLALGVSIGSNLIGPLSTMVGWLEKMKSAYDALPGPLKAISSPMNAAKAAFSEAAAAVETFTGKTGELPAVTGPAALGVAALATSSHQLELYVPTLTDALLAEKDTIRDLDTETRKLIEAHQAIIDAGMTWQDTVDNMDGTVVEAIKWYLSLGVSQKDLAAEYGRTAKEISSVAIALDEYSTALNNNAEMAVTAATRSAEITKQITADGLQAANDRILAEQQKNQAFLDSELKAAQAADAEQQAIHTTTAVTTQAASDIGTAFDLGFKKSADAFDNFKGVVVAGTGTIVQNLMAITDAGSAVEQRNDLYQAQMGRGQFFQNVGGAPLPMQTRDSGGPVTAGTPYLIGGGKEPEIFVPGASGFVTPGGGKGGGVQVSNVFHIVDTESNIARRVSAQITRSIMAAQKL